MNKLVQIMEITKECKKMIHESFSLCKKGEKKKAEELMEQVGDKLSEAVACSSDYFSMDRDSEISLNISYALDMLSDAQTMYELGKEILELY